MWQRKDSYRGSSYTMAAERTTTDKNKTGLIAAVHM